MSDLTLKFDGKFGERLDGWDTWRRGAIAMFVDAYSAGAAGSDGIELGRGSEILDQRGILVRACLNRNLISGLPTYFL
jgi:hypothetical protein